MTLLHIEAEGGRTFASFVNEVLLSTLFDALIVIPILFVAYLLMELIEHRASDKTRSFLLRVGAAGPLLGGALGIAPQCGFSAAAANFYTGRVITLGTLIAIFLSTSDEMLPILIAEGTPPLTIITVLLYKAIVGMAVGFGVDLVYKLIFKKKDDINIDAICESDGCHCENGIWSSALRHTLHVGLFVLVLTLATNILIFFIGRENIAKILYDKPVVSHIIAALLGLIPNCAVSVALTDFACEGFITAGTMLAGTFSGAGVGLMLLFRVNKRMRENLCVAAILFAAGVVFGLLFDLCGFSSVLTLH